MNLKPNLILAFVCLLISTNNIFAQSSPTLSAKAKRLKQLYTMAVNSSNSDIAKQQFFNEFPNTFKELNDLYGDENNKPGLLANDAIGHIYELFNNLTIINDTLYYRKLVSIAIGAHWDADGVNYFQDGLKKRVLSKPMLAVYLLQNKPDKDITDFWFFYFDFENSFSRKQSYGQIISQLPAKDKKMIMLVNNGYQRATKSWKDNH